MSALVCFNDNTCVAYLAHHISHTSSAARVIKSYKFKEVGRLRAECAVSLSEQASSSSLKSGKTCKWGGRETCSILIMHDWHILWNEWELLSVPLLPLPVFFFFFWRNTTIWGVGRSSGYLPNCSSQWTKKKKQATCFKCGLNSPEAQAVANRPERVRAWKDKRLLLKRPRMDTKKMAVSVCVFVPVRVSSSAPTGEEELKEEQIYPALTASAYRPLNGWGNKTHKITWICVYSCIASKWLLTDTLTYSNIGAALQFTLCNGVDGKPGGHSALLRTLTHCWVLIDPNVYCVIWVLRETPTAERPRYRTRNLPTLRRLCMVPIVPIPT